MSHFNAKGIPSDKLILGAIFAHKQQQIDISHWLSQLGKHILF